MWVSASFYGLRQHYIASPEAVQPATCVDQQRFERPRLAKTDACLPGSEAMDDVSMRTPKVRQLATDID